MFLSLKSGSRFLSLIFLLLLVSVLLFTAPGLGFGWGWLAFSFLIMLLVLLQDKQITITPVFLAFCVYTLVILCNIYFFNPVFHPEGLYFIAFLFVSFLVGRSLSQNQVEEFYRITVCIFSLLAVWGVIQYLTQSAQIVDAGNRANTVYHTPNHFAAVINLLLIPLVIYRLNNPVNRITGAGIYLLFIALLVTQSRGGWIAFASGAMVGIGVLSITGQLKLYKSNILFLTKLFILIFVFYGLQVTDAGYKDSPKKTHQTSAAAYSDNQEIRKDTTRLSTLEHRILFYKIAWKQFVEKPVLGNGYFNFQYYLQRDKTPEIARYGTSRFVHNDYLQHLLEVGLTGLIALLLLIGSFYYQAWVCIRNSRTQESVVFTGIVAGCTAYFVHAVGDFVFYWPGITLFFGMAVGIFDRAGFRYIALKHITLTPETRSQQFIVIKTIIGICLAGYMAAPVVARKASDFARENISMGNYTDAQENLLLARRLAPYESRYHYYEAKLWMNAVKLERSPQAAQVVDNILVKGIQVNHFEQNNLLLRAILHRDYPELLHNPAGMETILDWHEEILVWQPGDRASELEYIKSLSKAGREQEARQRYQAFQQKLLEDNKLKNLLSRALNPDK